jgi:hypothetical protein
MDPAVRIVRTSCRGGAWETVLKVRPLMRKAWTIAFFLLIQQQACLSHKPVQIEQLWHSKTSGWAHDVALEGSDLYVSDRQGGFAVFDRSWKRIRSFVPVRDVISLAPNSGMPVLASRFEGLVLLSQTEQVLDRYSNGDIANAVQIRGDLLFAAYGAHGLVIAQVGQNHIRAISASPTSGWSHDLRLSRSQAFIADWDRGLRTVDIRDPAYPVEVSLFPSKATTISLDIRESANERIAAIAEGNAGVTLASLDQAGRPSLLSRNFLGLNPAHATHPQSGGWVHGVAWAGHYLLVANWKRGLAVLDASDLRNPKLVQEARVGGTALAAKAFRQPDESYLIFLADGESGLWVFRLRE